jgi:4-hydroxythreonine-4-phosphate dehydrogenase
VSANLQSSRSAVRPAGARPTLAVTVGEPAGIGPEISIRAAWALREQANCVLLGDAAFLAMTAADIDPAIQVSALSQQALRNGGLPHFGPSRITVIDIPLEAHVVPGQLDPRNGRAVLATLDAAIEGVQAGVFDAWSPRRCKRAPSTTPACRSPATPNTSPTRLQRRRW